MQSKRVILVQGEGAWYEQAIFIVKNNSEHMKLPVDFVGEAERIVESYLSSDKRSPLVFSEISSSERYFPRKGSQKPKSRALDVAFILSLGIFAVIFLLLLSNKLL